MPRRIVALALLVALIAAPARAQEQVEPAPEAEEPAVPDEAAPGAEANEEIIVIGRREIERRRAEIERDLKGLGYRAKDGDEVTIYRPAEPWRPSVYVYDAGYVVIKRSPVRFEPPIGGSSNLRYLACLPPFTPLCVRVGGQTVSGRKLAPQKARVAQEIHPEVRAWQTAMVRQAMAERVGHELPTQLVATWERGEPLEQGGPPLPTMEERRNAILELWATRADTQEGAQVRAVVADFLRYVVQGSDTPATPAEIAAAEARCQCGPLLDAEGEGRAPAEPAPLP